MRKSKLRIPKPLSRVLIGIVALIILFIGAGLAYTYFDEPDTVENDSDVETAQQFYEPSLNDNEPGPDANVGVSVQMLTSPVAPGSNATFKVRTLRGAECDITVEYDGIESQDTGLMTKTADRFGMASWTWTVEETVPHGEWPIEVLCSRNEQSGMMRADLEVGPEE